MILKVLYIFSVQPYLTDTSFKISHNISKANRKDSQFIHLAGSGNTKLKQFLEELYQEGHLCNVKINFKKKK